MNRVHARWLWNLVAVLALSAACFGQSAAPRVEKVEPPNWWIGLPSPMLLIKGENLAEAKVALAAPKAGVKIERTQDGENGKYLFVWLNVGPFAQPGEVALSVKTKAGSARFTLPLSRRSPAATKPVTNGGFNGFSPEDVMYLIMPDRFANGDTANDGDPRVLNRKEGRAYHGGDLKGIREHLSYLKDLGVTTIWMTPIYQNDDKPGAPWQDYHGYGATDFYGVEDHLGTLKDYRELSDAAHAMGMKTVLDIVPNHGGPTHPWVKDPPTPYWLHGSKEKHLAAHSPFDGITDPHAPPREYRDVIEGWFANVLPDFNTSDPMVTEYMTQNAMWWIETGGLDGLRLDTFPYVDRSFWHEFHATLHKAYPRLKTVGEVFNGDPTITSYFAGGREVRGIDTGLDTPFDFPMYYTLRAITLRDEPMSKLPELLRLDSLYPHPENLVTFLGNHDIKRYMSMPGATPERFKLALGLLATLRGMPQLYAGDELGMEGGDDPDNRRDFPGGFPDDPRDAFTAAGRTAAENDIFDYLKKLLQLRKENSALRRGRLFHAYADDKAYAFVREDLGSIAGIPGGKHQVLLVVANNADAAKTITVEIPDTPLETAELVNSILAAEPAKLEKAKSIQVTIGPRALAIYEVKCGCDVE